MILRLWWSFFRRRSIPLTVQAIAPPESRLWIVPAHDATQITHELPVPRGACPVSGNPLSGVMRVTYTPEAHALEVAALLTALEWACGRNPGAPRSAEALARWFCDQAFMAVNNMRQVDMEEMTQTQRDSLVGVVVDLDMQVRPGPQRLRIMPLRLTTVCWW